MVLGIVFWSCAAGTAQSDDNALSEEMTRLDVQTALIYQSQSIDDSPLWSPEGFHLALNDQGNWIDINLRGIKLWPASWHQKKIGFAVKTLEVTPLEPSNRKRFQNATRGGSRQISTQSGSTVRLFQDGLSVSLQIEESDQPSRVLWKSDFENCYNLALSPDESFVAYICELNGLFVTRIPS